MLHEHVHTKPTAIKFLNTAAARTGVGMQYRRALRS